MRFEQLENTVLDSLSLYRASSDTSNDDCGPDLDRREPTVGGIGGATAAVMVWLALSIMHAGSM